MAKKKEAAPKKMSLRDRIKKASLLGATDLVKSDIFADEVFIDTGIPALNIALSGDLDGGLTRGMTMFAGPSKHFKTLFGLMCVVAYMKHYKDAECSFLDNEKGSTPSYWKNFGADLGRILYTFVANIEKLKIEAVAQLEVVEKDDRIIYFVDSIGNLASKTEMKDAVEGEAKEDAGRRAKECKSLLRTIAPYVNEKNVPMIVIGHTYNTLEKYSKAVVSGGTGPYYNCNNIIVVGRKQLKDGDDKIGSIFVLKVEKSRFVIEGKAIEMKVSYENGIYKYSGLLNLALESGHVVNSKPGYYVRSGIEGDKPVKESYIDQSVDFWTPILADPAFKQFVRDTYQLKGNLINNATPPQPEEDAD